MQRLPVYIILVFLFNSLSAQVVESEKYKNSPHIHPPRMTHAEQIGLRGYDVVFYDFDLSVSDTTSFIKGNVSVHFIPNETFPDTLWLDFSDNMLVDSIYADGQKQKGYKHQDDRLLIPFDDKIVGKSGNVTIFYEGTPKDGGNGRDGVFNANDGNTGTRVTYTLSEPFSAKNWFPCKQDLTDKADSVTMAFTVEKGLKVGSNGLLLDEKPLGDTHVRYVWESKYPIAYYLMSFSVANYDEYSFYAHPPGREDSILIQNYIYANPGYLSANKEKLDATADLLEYYSDIFSMYPFADEKYGHTTAPFGGGMEHQTMSTMLYYEFFLVAHELAHQWFGDNVTCASWQDIWINEGFASYAEYLGFQALVSQQQADQWMNTAQSRALREPDGSVYVPFEEITNEDRIFAYNLTYKKGAAILHMLRHELGDDDLFFEVLRTFQKEYKDSVATGNDFISVLNQITEEDYQWFFNQWYYGKGYPVFDIKWVQENDTVYIYSNQSGSYAIDDLFNTKMEFRLNFTYDSDIYYFRQLSNTEVFKIKTDAKVLSVNFDPDNWLLKEVSQNSNLDTRLVNNNLLDIFPNPASQSISVRINNPAAASGSVQVVTLDAKILLHEIISTPKTKIDLHQVPDGIYLLRLQLHQGGTYVKRFIKITPK